MNMEDINSMATEQANAEKAQKAVEKKRRLNLIAMLTPEARERLDRLALVNAAKAEAVGDMIVAHCENGLVSQRITDAQMKDYLDQVNNNMTGKVQIQRKRYGDDSEDDDDNDDDL